jgi:hypothetical protein
MTSYGRELRFEKEKTVVLIGLRYAEALGKITNPNGSIH